MCRRRRFAGFVRISPKESFGARSGCSPDWNSRKHIEIGAVLA
jgi:hypothetical protein